MADLGGRGVGAPMRGRRAVAGAVLALALLTACDYRGTGTTQVALLGDSIADDADRRTVTEMRARYLYWRFNVRAGAIEDQLLPLALLLRDDPPDVLIIELGLGDAQAWHGDRRMRRDIRKVLYAARRVPCVRWLNVKEAGVHPFYQGVVARGDDFNRHLAELTRRYPNARLVDYDRWAQARPGHFLADGLHHNRRGRAAFARWLATAVVGTC